MKKHLITFLFLCICFWHFAGIETFNERMKPALLGSGQTIEVYDQRYAEMGSPGWTSSFYNRQVTNKVRIGYLPGHFPDADVTNTVQVRVDYWHLVSGVFVQVTEYRDLQISFKANGQLTMEDQSTFTFADAHKVKVTVNSITGSNAGKHIFLDAEIEVERYYTLPDLPVNDLGHRLTGTSGDRLEFYWDPMIGAEAYELEWAYVSDYDYNIGAHAVDYRLDSELDFDFLRNATRVRIKNSFYEIPAVFDHGYLVYRVRPIGKQGTNLQYRKEGAWSFAESGTISSFPSANKIFFSADYEAGKNWAHQVGYTEDGKRFEGVAFMDGLGRTRQVVSLNTQTGQSLVNNTYYDRIGRPVVSDLPTPVAGGVLKHYPDFNYGVDLSTSASLPYGYVHFDYDAEGVCLPATNPFSTTHGGAGKYYSENNPDKQGANAMIPDASGYPFAQVEYLNDQTGRIRRSGAYGEQNQLNQHSTQYFYDTPLQPELDLLFGTEAGWVGHYKRTVTIDPNGQAYVSYYDLAGRVIASCLAGDKPDNVDALPNNEGDVLTPQVIYSGTGIQEYNQPEAIVSYNKPYTVISDAEYSFSHEFTPSEFEDECLPEGFCYDCFYDLTFTIEDMICPGESPVYEHTETINGWTIDNICNGAGYEGTTATVSLEKGQYNISKTLRVSEGAAEAYWCSYVSSSECLPSYADIYNQMYAETDFGCIETPVEPTGLNECEKSRRMMAIDMSFNGQYGKIYNSSGVISLTDPLSIYNESNTLPNGGNWRLPDGNYLDDNGNIVKIYVTGGPGNYTPAVANETLIMTALDGSKYIYPENLNSFTDYRHYWRASWAYALVKYHPEYCYLKFCDENIAFHEYTDAMFSVDGYDEACALGFFDPIQTGPSPVPASGGYYDGCYPNVSNPDLSFTSTFWSNLQTLLYTTPHYNADMQTLQDAMENFRLVASKETKLSIWEYAVWQVYCADLTDVNDIKDCVAGKELNDCTKDIVWRNFRAEYQKLREHYYLLGQTFYVSYPNTLTGGGCGPAFNGCIGDASYSPSAALEYNIKPSEHWNGSTVTYISNTSGPCSNTTAASYANKTPRFQNLKPIGGIAPPGVDVTDPADVENYMNQQAAIECAAVCASYADDWMAKLKGCYSPTDPVATDIRLALIEVCKDGCSLQNPGGSTTAPGATPFQSFAEVLSFYLGANYESAVCSEYLISTPMPQGQNEAEQEHTLDQCGCDKLTKARTDYENGVANSTLPPNVHSVEDMLRFNEGIDLVSASALLCACDKYFPEEETGGRMARNASVSIPVVQGLTCGKECVPCSQIQGLYTDFSVKFQDEVNFEAHPNYELLFANYMNSQLGYHLSYEQYAAFLENCDATSSSPSCALNSTAKVFKDLMDVIARQGKLTAALSNAYDMQAENIVYQFSHLYAVPGVNKYWTSISGDQITLYFGDDLNPGVAYSAIFELPLDADFGFGDIIGVTDIQALNSCDKGGKIELTVRVVVCGRVETRYLEGNGGNLGLLKCYCGFEDATLCDEPSPAPDAPCYERELEILAGLSEEQFESAVAGQRDAFIASYKEQCSSAFETDKLVVTGPVNFYQYTLYYYDQAGNLVKTVAPNGSLDPGFIASGLANVEDDRQNNVPNFPHQKFATKYKYNSYNQVVSTTNPDQEGETVFWYDRYGRIIASQNPVQAGENKYSYSLYDPQGRPVQSGQVVKASAPTFPMLTGDNLGTAFEAWVVAGTRTEVNISKYDEILSSAISAQFASGQQNLRLRVASVLYFETFTGSTNVQTDYSSAQHYSYDVHGNVLEMLQDVPMMAVVQQDIKSTRYAFELISGNVKQVDYQQGKRDAMRHSYSYDQLNRLTEVHSSTDGGIHQSREAKYKYYDYGPLARVEIGQYQVQGMDYAYTINGWIKGMNSNTLKPLHDGGADGMLGCDLTSTNPHRDFARDVTGYTLGYYQGDYKGIGNPAFESQVFTLASNPLSGAISGLYNGNISHLVTAVEGFETQATVYRYDQLQRLKSMRVFRATDIAVTNSWQHALETNEYKNSYTYDQNGNIKTLLRNSTAALGIEMDKFTYNYTTVNDLLGVPQPSNRLDYVPDAGANDAANTGDIKAGMTAGNYGYDQIGQLTKDEQEGIASIAWFSGSKKVKKIVRSSAKPDADETEFVYNPFGQRILKISKPRVAGVVQPAATWKYSYYGYDANGQVMAVYETMLQSTEKDVRLEEQNIYGASRIGLNAPYKLIYSAVTTITDPVDVRVNTLGNKSYELTNYLGNVNAVITDRKMPVAPQMPAITDAAGISVSGGTITRTLASTGTVWNAGGASVEKIDQGGYMEWTLGTPSDNHYARVGLSYTNPNLQNHTILYSWYANPNGNSYIIEGAVAPGYYAASVAGDVLRVSREGCMIKYFINGTEVRSVTDPQPLTPMLVDFSIGVQGKLIYGLKIVKNARYEAVVKMKADYYPFGMTMPGRNENSADYRYGYNGMEKDDNAKGNGNSYTTEFRQYDPRLGRWLSLDPMMVQFPWMSPYVGFDNNPILYVDPYGLSTVTAGDPPPQRTDENGNLVDWKSGDEFEDKIFDGEKWRTVTQLESFEMATLSPESKRKLYLVAVAARGALDAAANANTLGLYYVFGGNHYDDYDDTDEQFAYLTGQLAGNLASIVTGNTELVGGLSAAGASLATGPGALVAAPVAGLVAAHGAGVITVATAEEIRIGIEIANMIANANHGGSSAGSGDGDGDSEPLDAETIRKEKGIPDDWIVKPSKRDGGIRFIDPKNSGNHVRVMPGRANSPHPNSRSKYVVRYINGASVDKSGRKVNNPTGQKQNKQSGIHVPYSEFKFN